MAFSARNFDTSSSVCAGGGVVSWISSKYILRNAGRTLFLKYAGTAFGSMFAKRGLSLIYTEIVGYRTGKAY